MKIGDIIERVNKLNSDSHPIGTIFIIRQIIDDKTCKVEVIKSINKGFTSGREITIYITNCIVLNDVRSKFYRLVHDV